MTFAILFDSDNTLYASRDAAKLADFKAMEKLSKICGVDPEVLLEEWKSIVDELKESKDPKLRHRRYSYSLLLKRYGVDEKVCEEIYETFFQNFLNGLKLFDGVGETLEKLREAGVKLVIVSEDFKEQLKRKIEFLGIKKFFDFFVTCDDVGVMKPSGRYYEIVKEKLNLPFEKMVVVGDSFEKDLEIPKMLGMRCVLLFDEDMRADFSFKDFREILNILDLNSLDGE
jgi:putative hydrolase of the HAD superfamily